MKVYLLEVSNIGKCSHYQAVFNSFELADKARSKYLNDPACDPTKMKAIIFPHKVHTDLTILDIVQSIQD